MPKDPVMKKVRMLRNLAFKPDVDEEDQRYEGRIYNVPLDEYRDLVGKGLAVDAADENAFALVVEPKSGNRKKVRLTELPEMPVPPRQDVDEDETSPPPPPAPTDNKPKK